MTADAPEYFSAFADALHPALYAIGEEHHECTTDENHPNDADD